MAEEQKNPSCPKCSGDRVAHPGHGHDGWRCRDCGWVGDAQDTPAGKWANWWLLACVLAFVVVFVLFLRGC